MLDVRRVRVFAEVAARGSFSAAAQALSLTQSAVSQHVASLEREVGLPLVERGVRPVALTEAGFALARQAPAIFARIDGAEQELAEIAGRRDTRLRFGSFPTALATIVPPAFAHFRMRDPDATLEVVDDHLQRLLPRLDDGELDLAVIYEDEALPEVGARDLVRVHLLDDEFRAVLPPGHRLAGSRRPLTLADLRAETWIGGSPRSAWWRIVLHACRAAGFEPELRHASDDYVAVQAFVAAGLGVAVIPGLAVAHPLPQLTVRGVAGAPVRRIHAARRPGAYQGRAVRGMLDSLRVAARDYGGTSLVSSDA